jgi:hypothetical protein
LKNLAPKDLFKNKILLAPVSTGPLSLKRRRKPENSRSEKRKSQTPWKRARRDSSSDFNYYADSENDDDFAGRRYSKRRRVSSSTGNPYLYASDNV